MAEALSALAALGWALAVWVLVLGAAGTVGLLGTVVAVVFAGRGVVRAWRGLCGRLRAEVPESAPRVLPTPERRSGPRWALPLDTAPDAEKSQEAA